ncbi:ABC transporter ATP-binding protein [Actinoplanes sp. NPDC026670]|uniref:ABC transporter ATP-binding protein n=1 Tax=Actinoplanes sp. NPDC026670 TaxID=3154700 RepID=UPI0033DA0B7F
MTTVAGAVFAIVWMGCQALVPAVLGWGVDAMVERDTSGLLAWALTLLGLGVVQAVTGTLRHRFAVTSWLAAAFRTVQVVVRHAGHLGSTLTRRTRAGEVVSIGTSDITHIGGAVDITSRGTGAVVTVIVVAVLMLNTSVVLGLVILIGISVTIAASGLLLIPVQRGQRQYRDRQGRLTGRAVDLVEGLRVLSGLGGGEPLIAARYRAESQGLRAAGVKAVRTEALFEAAQVLLTGALLILVTWLGARLAASGRITVGQLVSFYAYAAFLWSPLRQVIEMMDKVTRGLVPSRRVIDMLRLERDLPDPPCPTRVPDGELADPLTGVVIPAGRFTAIVAKVPEQAAQLADRLGRYTAGGTMAGVPLTAMAAAELRRQVLVATNDALIFGGRLRANLDTSQPGILDEALEAACATDIIDELPEGLSSWIADPERYFSGGQLQRLRLARALAADPEILILVDPTNAVDALTEARIAGRLRLARSGRTTVVCTSSPFVLSWVDQVIYVEDERVVAVGSHDDLVRSEPRYVRMVWRGDRS